MVISAFLAITYHNKQGLQEKSIAIIVAKRVDGLKARKPNQRFRRIKKGRTWQELNLQPSDP